MYYIMSSETDCILETVSTPPTQDELQTEADFFNCAVYVIEGQHYGMSAEPSEDMD